MEADDAASCVEPCGELTYAGRCQGDRIEWCQGGRRRTGDCRAAGERAGVETTCAWDPQRCGAWCAGCGDIPDGGRCRGDQLERCVQGSPEITDCAAYGKTCEVMPDGEAWCVSPGELASCDPDEVYDFCEDGLHRWCDESGHYRSFDCVAHGLICRVHRKGGSKFPLNGAVSLCRGCDVPWWDDGCYDGRALGCDANTLTIRPCNEACHEPR